MLLGSQLTYTVQTSARFYEGLSLPSTFKTDEIFLPNGTLLATYIDPQFPATNATSAASRSRHLTTRPKEAPCRDVANIPTVEMALLP